MRHLIDPLDLTQQEITQLLDLADRICADPAAYQEVANHKKLATLFYEPSTRTRLSFEAAMLNLGGHVLGFPSENVSSATKGESVADTIRVVSCYADIVAMRHPKEGAPLRASRYSRIPVINAGDGGHQHPTQTLTDLMTIRRRMGRLDDLTIGLCGDLKFGRTVHSLLKTMARCKNVRFVLISPEELRVPDYIINDVLEANGIPYKETRSLEESMPELDILYMTRVQKERFFNEEDYIRLKNSYVLTREKMAQAKPTMAVLHPVKLTVTNYPEGQSETFTVENNPTDPTQGTHEITFGRHLWIETEDFLEMPIPKYKRLYPDGPECRLKGAYLIRCTGCVKDENGHVTEVLCEYDPNSRGGDPADGRKVKGATLHWVDADNCLDAEVRLYDNLFSDPQPDGPDKNFLDCLNPDSLMVLRGCKVERSMAAVAEEFDHRENRTGVNAPTFQFMRTGYFCMDNRDCTAEHLVFNRSVSLKDSFKK